MTLQGNDPRGERTDHQLVRQVDDLCAKLQDEVITDDECGTLNRLLKSGPLARHRYLINVLLNSLLIDWLGKRDRVEAEELGVHVDTNATKDPLTTERPQAAEEPLVRLPADPGVSNWGWGMLATALALLMVSIFAISRLDRGWFIANRPPQTTPDLSQPTENDKTLAESQPSEAFSKSRVLATISSVSSSARLKHPEKKNWLGASLESGHVLEIEEGAIELTYESATRVLLIAPAYFVVQPEGGRLVRGGLAASVSEQGQGFTVITPNGKVVDLGTEFGVAVDDFGVSQVSVFEGKVEAFPVTADLDGSKKVELLGGESLQWKRGRGIRRGANSRNFASAILGREIETWGDGFRQSDEFRDSIDPTKWTTLGAVRASENGLVMTAAEVADERPYLMTTEQFDPLMGPVSVTCDFQFSDFGDGDAPVVGVMTRSANERGVAAEPWNGILASCVCCSFGAVSETQEGVLQTSVKLGSENLMSSVSWSGRLPPQPKTRYRMVMRDDGVNVSLTVSLIEDPTVTQTVTCRSLFQGKRNHIALGGLITGSAVIDRLEILQDQSEDTISNYNELCLLLESNPAQRALERKLLENFVPDDAALVQQDSFTDTQLDIKKWRTLGEVFLEGSEVHLGVPNDDGLIDTWKSRPYLLTDMPLDPSKGPLTIIGKVSFAENFRSGYGATFAVMTRANTERGDGHGWENSILQRGLRATFWPTSADKNHVLEIHEKPTENTITLLGKQAVDIDPFTRSYIFRVVDDGDSIALTVVDPKTPNRKMEVRSQTSSSLTSGYVGFESCWGSPVRLDSIRIYQGNLGQESK